MHSLTALLAFAVFVVAVLRDEGAAYPTGPPLSTCVTQFPKHGAEKLTGEAPFNLTFSSDTYMPGQTVALTIQATQPGVNFTGFQVTAHRVASSGNTEEFVGAFSTEDSSSKTSTCLGHAQAMLSHSSGAERTTVQGKWTAPSVNKGDLQFFVTIVERKLKFWHRLPFSLPVQSSAEVVPPVTTIPPVSASNTATLDWEQCGKSKGCWLVPPQGKTSCSGGSDCHAALSYRKDNDRFHFEMAVKGERQFVAVGFSDDRIMGDDQVVSCVGEPGFESIQMGYNIMYPTYKLYDRQFTNGVSNVVAGKADGDTYCKFTSTQTLSSLNGTGTRVFDLNNKHFLFLAWGHVFEGTDVNAKHTVIPAISAARVDLTEDFTTSRAISPVTCISLLLAALLSALFTLP